MPKLGPNTLRTKKAAETRAKVLKAAFIEFTAAGYEATTIRGIAKAAGVTTGSIFAHWPGKDELYREAIGRNPPSEALVIALTEALQRADWWVSTIREPDPAAIRRQLAAARRLAIIEKEAAE